MTGASSLLFPFVLACGAALQAAERTIPGRVVRPMIEVVDDGETFTISRRLLPVTEPGRVLVFLLPLLLVGLGVVHLRERRALGVGIIVVSVVGGALLAGRIRHPRTVVVDRQAREVRVFERTALGTAPAPVVLPFDGMAQVGVALLVTDGPSWIVLDFTNRAGTRHSIDIGSMKEADGLVAASALRDQVAQLVGCSATPTTPSRYRHEETGARWMGLFE